MSQFRRDELVWCAFDDEPSRDGIYAVDQSSEDGFVIVRPTSGYGFLKIAAGNVRSLDPVVGDFVRCINNFGIESVFDHLTPYQVLAVTGDVSRNPQDIGPHGVRHRSGLLTLTAKGQPRVAGHPVPSHRFIVVDRPGSIPSPTAVFSTAELVQSLINLDMRLSMGQYYVVAKPMPGMPGDSCVIWDNQGKEMYVHSRLVQKLYPRPGDTVRYEGVTHNQYPKFGTYHIVKARKVIGTYVSNNAEHPLIAISLHGFDWSVSDQSLVVVGRHGVAKGIVASSSYVPQLPIDAEKQLASLRNQVAVLSQECNRLKELQRPKQPPPFQLTPRPKKRWTVD